MKSDDRGYGDAINDSMDDVEGGLVGSGTKQSPHEIEQDIERTRERMSGNIDALGEKLSPENLKRQAQDVVAEKAQQVVANVEERARQTGDRLVEFIRDNPLPVAAVSIGALWLFTQRKRSEISGDRMARFAYTGPNRRAVNGGSRLDRLAHRASEMREAVTDVASGVSERAGDLLEKTQYRAGELSGEARERVHHFTDRAREQTQRARGGLNRMISENPLVVAAGAIVLGATIGMLLPETEPERRFMGSASSTVLDRAHEVADQVKDAAMEAGNEVKEAVREQITERGPEVKNLVKDAVETVSEQVKESASRVTQEARRAAVGKSDPTIS